MAVVGGGNITAMDPPIAEQTRSLDNEPSSDPHHLLLVGLGFGGNSPPRTSIDGATLIETTGSTSSSGHRMCLSWTSFCSLLSLLFEAPPHQIDSRQCRIEERPVGIKLIVVAAEELIPARSWWICVDLFAEGVGWMACSGEHLKPKHARKRGRNEEEGK
ncbi:Os12g0490900 [Oryza sativa Japonica Group]|uniref:Os12g0490900 protein n=1 Tax=Oryza sativa subsp. japonica TaxID=39947 RepID=A0A0P0YA72_ORYSJ|nr:Os12g0490900 [Oryza sativa Japonica Group]